MATEDASTNNLTVELSEEDIDPEITKQLALANDCK